MGHHPQSTMLGRPCRAGRADPASRRRRRHGDPACTARAGTSARSPTTPGSCRPPRPNWPAPASAPSTIGCATPSAAAVRSTTIRGSRASAPACSPTRTGRATAGRRCSNGTAAAPRRTQIKVGLTGNLAGLPARRPVRRPAGRARRSGYNGAPGRVHRGAGRGDHATSTRTTTRPCSTPWPSSCRSATSMAARVRMNTAVPGHGRARPGHRCSGTPAPTCCGRSPWTATRINSGDWFNRIDWTGADNRFGSGLPPAPDNQAEWPFHRPLLADPVARPGPGVTSLRPGLLPDDLLRLRYSSPLFRFGSAAQIGQRVSFPDRRAGSAGRGDPDGASPTTLTGAADLDPDRDRIVVIFNATPWWQTVPVVDAQALRLHPGPAGRP